MAPCISRHFLNENPQPHSVVGMLSLRDVYPAKSTIANKKLSPTVYQKMTVTSAEGGYGEISRIICPSGRELLARRILLNGPQADCSRLQEGFTAQCVGISVRKSSHYSKLIQLQRQRWCPWVSGTDRGECTQVSRRLKEIAMYSGRDSDLQSSPTLRRELKFVVGGPINWSDVSFQVQFRSRE